MASMLDCFEELEAGIGVVTETWLKDGAGLDGSLEELNPLRPIGSKTTHC